MLNVWNGRFMVDLTGVCPRRQKIDSILIKEEIINEKVKFI